MSKYQFDTIATMKTYNNKKWWIDRNIIPIIYVNASNLKEALQKYAEIVKQKYYVSISKNALSRKVNMYIDSKEGEPIQTGYVITGKTNFKDNSGQWTAQYIDLWTSISIVTMPDFQTA